MGTDLFFWGQVSNYEHILSEMKQQGKAVIVGTHNDRYFHVPNRVLRMEDGVFVPV